MNAVAAITLERALGCVLGLAVGDALGATLEFRTREAIRRDGWLRDIRGGGWLDLEPGEVTDDTQMMTCVLESYAYGFDLETVAARFLVWFNSRPKDVGNLTRTALHHLSRGVPPRDAGRLAWEASGRSGAGNGALMRCAPTALARRDHERRARDTVDVARITHYDVRCVESCVWLNAALAALLEGESVTDALDRAGREVMWARVNVEYASDTAVTLGGVRDVLSWVDGAATLGAEALDTSGYTLATAQVGAWALLTAPSFEDGLIAVVNQGGDADTTGAVAGALLGARFGLSGIPERWLAVLQPRSSLERLTRLALEQAG